MRRMELVTGIGLIAAAAVAILLNTSHSVPLLREPAPRRVRASRPQAGRVTRRPCVRLGWRAPYWYAGAVNGWDTHKRM